MPRKRPPPERVAIPISSDLIERIDEYRWSERIPSRAEAIRKLLDTALRQHERHGKKPPSD